MNDKEALICVKKEILEYKKQLKENIFEEVLGSSVYFCSTLSIAYIYSALTNEQIFKELPYALAILTASIMTFRNHSTYSRSLEEVKMLKELKRMQNEIVLGNNLLEDVQKEDFKIYIKNKLS